MNWSEAYYFRLVGLSLLNWLFFLLQVTQQLPEYGVLVHHVLPEKIKGAGEMALGICAKDVIFYEVKNNSRIATLQFQWRDQEDFYLCECSSVDNCFISLWSVAPIKEQRSHMIFP